MYLNISIISFSISCNFLLTILLYFRKRHNDMMLVYFQVLRIFQVIFYHSILESMFYGTWY